MRRARYALGLWGPPGAGKAVWVGFWGSSICVGVTISADPSAAKWLCRNSEKNRVKIGRARAAGEVLTVGRGVRGKVGPGGGGKMSRLIVSRRFTAIL